MRILLADDHALVRAGIRALLEKIPDVEAVAEASNGRQAIEMVKTASPNLVLMDIAMAGLGGLEALPRITKEFPEVRVVILSAHANEEYVIRALRCGAAGYMVKDAAAEELELAIKAVAQGKTFLSSSVSRPVVDRYLQGAAGEEVRSNSSQRASAKSCNSLRKVKTQRKSLLPWGSVPRPLKPIDHS